MSDLVDLGLRFDLTVPLTRFYGHHQAALPLPFRSLQFGPVWRAERPQKGRYRQFYQCDIDLIGEVSVLAEAELIEATTEALAEIGLSGATVRLSDRRFLSALAQEVGVPEEAWPPEDIAAILTGPTPLKDTSAHRLRDYMWASDVPTRALALCEEKIQDITAALQHLSLGTVARKYLHDLVTHRLTASLDRLRDSAGRR